MGEDPAAVENVGGLGDENLRSLPLLSRAALAESIGFGLDRPYALVTYHPETAGGASPAAQFDALCAALERCGLAAVFTKANADAGGADINARIDAVCAARPGQYVAFTSMGVLRYLSAMNTAPGGGQLVLRRSGNALAGRACVNVGDRQKGRLLSANIICCAADEASVYAALQKALSPAFAAQARQAKSPTTAATPAAHRAAAGGVRAKPVAWKAQAVLRRPVPGGKRRHPMSGLADSFREMGKRADGAGTAEHLGARLLDGALIQPCAWCARRCLCLRRCCWCSLCCWFSRGESARGASRFRRDAGRGAGTVRLGLFSRMDGGGINGTPRGGGPVKGSVRGLLPEAIHRY